MDSHSIGMIIGLVFLVMMSAFFSATETAFSSLNRIRIKNLAAKGSKKARLTYKLCENYDKLLSTILIGNNITNIAATSIATVLFVQSFGDMGATLSTVAMTLVVLIFGEISPKSLAKESPESVAMFTAPMINLLMVVLKPFTFLFSGLKSLLIRVFKMNGNSRSVTESELLTIVQEAEQEGGINNNEGELIRHVIEFDDLAAEDIITPRVDIVAVHVDTSNEEVAKVFTKTGYSRLPVYGESIDNILGIVHEKNFYSTVWNRDKTISSIIKPALFVPPSMKISVLLKRLQNSKRHIAVVVDEFGGTEGIVTLEDIVEELVGEIWDEHDTIARESFKKDASDRYIVYCSTDLDDFLDYFNFRCTTEASSLNGFIMEHFDNIPSVGDRFTVMDVPVYIHKMDNNRVVEIAVAGEPLPDSYYEEEAQ